MQVYARPETYIHTSNSVDLTQINGNIVKQCIYNGVNKMETYAFRIIITTIEKRDTTKHLITRAIYILQQHY